MTNQNTPMLLVQIKSRVVSITTVYSSGHATPTRASNLYAIGSVCLSFCLSVCLCTASCKKYAWIYAKFLSEVGLGPVPM